VGVKRNTSNFVSICANLSLTNTFLCFFFIYLLTCTSKLEKKEPILIKINLYIKDLIGLQEMEQFTYFMLKSYTFTFTRVLSLLLVHTSIAISYFLCQCFLCHSMLPRNLHVPVSK